MSTGRLLTVFSIATNRGAEADALRHIEVKADLDLATKVADLRVTFSDHGILGRHVELHSPTHVVATFPCFGHADERLAGGSQPWEGLDHDDVQQWEDLDQGWYQWWLRDGNSLYVFESDFDGLCDLPGLVVAEPTAVDGVVSVGAVEATWSCWDLGRVRQAWRVAAEEARQLITGDPGRQ